MIYILIILNNNSLKGLNDIRIIYSKINKLKLKIQY